MSSHQIQPETSGQLIYREDHCGIRWPTIVHGVLGPVALIGFGIAMNLPHLAALGVLFAAAIFWALLGTLNLWGSLQIGVRIDSDGIQIGHARPGPLRKSYDGTVATLDTLTVLFMKAALVIVNDPRHATSDPPARWFGVGPAARLPRARTRADAPRVVTTCWLRSGLH